MNTRYRFLSVGFLAVFVASLMAVGLFGQAADRPDLDAIYKIKAEGLQHSQVMEIESYLTDVYGPRLTGSPSLKAAAEYAKQKLTEWGLVNARLEPWGPFGRGWSNDRFSAQVIAPQTYPIIAYSKAWTPGTDGMVTAEAILSPIKSEKDFETYHGKLKGKIIFTGPARDIEVPLEAPAHRFTDAELIDLARQPNPAPVRHRIQFPAEPPPALRQAMGKAPAFYLAEGVTALADRGAGEAGTVFARQGGSPDVKAPPVLPQIVIAAEQYGRIVRTLEKNIPVTLELNIKNTFYDTDLNSFTVVGEIPGADKADEVVMVGGHLDAWQAGTGATDRSPQAQR